MGFVLPSVVSSTGNGEWRIGNGSEWILVASIIHGGFGITINTLFDRADQLNLHMWNVMGTWINTDQAAHLAVTTVHEFH